MITEQARKRARKQLAKEPQHDIPCPGAAHGNAYIDNCMLCAPRWGVLSLPSRFATLDEYRDALDELADPGGQL